MAYNVVNLPKITVNIKKWSNVGFKTKIVDELPETGEEGIIYLLSARKSSSLIQKTSTTYAIPLATVQTEVIYKKDFTVDNITGIKAGMTLRFVGNGTMGYATVESVTVSTKTVTMTNPISLSIGTLVFDNATWSHDSYNEYIWNITNGSFEKLGLIDLNVQSKAIAQSIVGRDWSGRAQIATPSVADDIANKGYVDTALGDKLNKTAELNKIYGTQENGYQYLYNISKNAEPHSVVSRTEFGTIKAEYPREDNDVATQKSINAGLNKKLNRVNKESDYLSVYAVTDTGGDAFLKQRSDEALAWSVPLRFRQGQILAARSDIEKNPEKLKDSKGNPIDTDNFVVTQGQLKEVDIKINNRVQKTNSTYILYGTTGKDSADNTIQSELPFRTTVSNNSIAQRTGTGQLKAGNPIEKEDLTTKEYVDSAVPDLGNFTFDTDTLKNTNSGAKITLGSDGSQYIPNNLQITSDGISRTNKDDGMGANDWSITGGGANMATLTAGFKSETLENIIDAPSKIANKQDILVSGTNIKTINGESVLGEGNITVTPTIDDTLSDTSTNAVQNKVVKAAIDGKLDKITEGNVLKLYSHTGAKQSEVEATTNLSGGTVPLRDGYGNLQTKTVVNDLDVTNKKYVDDKVSSALTLTSPNGTKYKITVDDTGTLSATEIGQ